MIATLTGNYAFTR